MNAQRVESCCSNTPYLLEQSRNLRYWNNLELNRRIKSAPRRRRKVLGKRLIVHAEHFRRAFGRIDAHIVRTLVYERIKLVDERSTSVGILDNVVRITEVETEACRGLGYRKSRRYDNLARCDRSRTYLYSAAMKGRKIPTNVSAPAKHFMVVVFLNVSKKDQKYYPCKNNGLNVL